MKRESLDSLFALALSQVEDERIREQLRLIQEEKDEIQLPEELLSEEDIESLQDESKMNLAHAIRDMTIPQKIKLALLGNMVARALLIRDTNWMIAGFVLENPRLTEGEVQEFARNTNLDDQVMRAIAGNSQWMRNYAIKLAIVGNPKTPVDVSIKWIKFLQDKDLRNIAKSKGVPQLIATQCRKLVEQRNKKPGQGH